MQLSLLTSTLPHFPLVTPLGGIDLLFEGEYLARSPLAVEHRLQSTSIEILQ